MLIDPTEGLGLVAGAIGAFAMAPQAIKIFRDRSARDVSGVMYAMVLTAALMWTAYGALRGAPAIVLWNLVSAALAGAVLALKVRSDRR